MLMDFLLGEMLGDASAFLTTRGKESSKLNIGTCKITAVAV